MNRRVVRGGSDVCVQNETALKRSPAVVLVPFARNTVFEFFRVRLAMLLFRNIQDTRVATPPHESKLVASLHVGALQTEINHIHKQQPRQRFYFYKLIRAFALPRSCAQLLLAPYPCACAVDERVATRERPAITIVAAANDASHRDARGDACVDDVAVALQ